MPPARSIPCTCLFFRVLLRLLAQLMCCDWIGREFEGVYLDYSRQQATTETIDKLFELAKVLDNFCLIPVCISGESIMPVCFY